MSSSIYTGKSGTNPYRSGVLIGNYVEDMFGLDLQQKYSNLRKTVDLSEQQDRYRWPYYKLEHLGKTGNDLTMSCNMNYDLNIDFSRNKPEDFKKLSKPNEYALDNKNIFLPDEIKIMKYKKTVENEKNNIIPKETMESQTQNALCKLNSRDATNILFTKKAGLSGNLLFGHGDQNNFDKSNLASVNDLTINQHIRTKDFINDKWNNFRSSYKINQTKDRDYSDCGYRKYREYGFFTKKFDKKKNK